MQTYDTKNKIKSARIDSAKELARQAAIEIESPDTTSVVIGKMPKYRQDIMINSLVYRVKFVNHKTGELTLKLKGVITEPITSAKPVDAE